MKKRDHGPTDFVGLAICAALLPMLTGCVVAGPAQHPRYQPRTQVAVAYEDDYDYYPNYEIYYSRSRHEYVYLDGHSWVRRAEPRGVSIDVLFAAPSVRMDFRDSPEKHHGAVILKHPKNREKSKPQPGDKGNNRKGKGTDKKHERDDDKDSHKKDRDDGLRG